MFPFVFGGLVHVLAITGTLKLQSAFVPLTPSYDFSSRMYGHKLSEV